MKIFVKSLIPIAYALALAGCKTPQPALDQANNGAALTMTLKAQLTNLRTTQAKVAKARIDSIHRQKAQMALYQVDSAFDERVRLTAGDSARAQLLSTLRDLGDSRGKDQKDLDDALAALDKDMSALLAPVPDVDAKLGAAQQALAALGQELPLPQRAALLAGFASDVNKSLEQNRKKSEDAAAAAPTAPVQDPPANVPVSANPG
jgi:hypothetical protein